MSMYCCIHIIMTTISKPECVTDSSQRGPDRLSQHSGAMLTAMHATAALAPLEQTQLVVLGCHGKSSKSSL